MAGRFLGQRGQHVRGRSEGVVDHLGQLARRPLPVGRRQALPEEAVVPGLGGVVEQLLLAALAGGPDQPGQRQAFHASRVGQLVGLVDIGAVMLAVMEIERLGGHVPAQRLPIERQVGKRERHDISPSVTITERGSTASGFSLSAGTPMAGGR
jgi:hypothetical protein